MSVAGAMLFFSERRCWMVAKKLVTVDAKSIAKELEKDLKKLGMKPDKSGLRKVSKQLEKKLSK